jgi:hypothetical protein
VHKHPHKHKHARSFLPVSPLPFSPLPFSRTTPATSHLPPIPLCRSSARNESNKLRAVANAAIAFRPPPPLGQNKVVVDKEQQGGQGGQASGFLQQGVQASGKIVLFKDPDMADGGGMGGLGGGGSQKTSAAAMAHVGSAVFAFKPPVDQTAAKRKNIGAFISKLKDRVGEHKVLMMESLAQIEDDDTLTSSNPNYFDRSAPPVVLERDKNKQAQSSSKRYSPGTGYEAERSEKPDKSVRDKSVRGPKRIEEEEEEEGSVQSAGWVPPMLVRGKSASGSKRGLLGSGGSGRTHSARGLGTARSGSDALDTVDEAKAAAALVAEAAEGGGEVGAGVPPVQPLFNIEKFVAALSEEERGVLTDLPAAMVQRIYESMNVREDL